MNFLLKFTKIIFVNSEIMFKNIALIFILFISFITYWFAEEVWDTWAFSAWEQSENQAAENETSDYKIASEKAELDQLNKDLKLDYNQKNAESVNLQKEVDELKNQTTDLKNERDEVNWNPNSTKEEKEEADSKYESVSKEYGEKIIEKRKFDNENNITEESVSNYKKLVENQKTQEKSYNQALIKNWNLAQKTQWTKYMLDLAEQELFNAQEASKNCWNECSDEVKSTLTNAQKNVNGLKADYQKAKEEYDNSELAENDITSRWFEIKVDTFTPWLKLESIGAENTNQVINYTLGTIIQRLMIALWSFSLIIMTIWAWYIILHNWQDELLNKWKSIFMSWVYALVVALSAYYLVSIVRFIIFS